MLKNKIIAIIGTGNMGDALISIILLFDGGLIENDETRWMKATTTSR